jgi:hypothetical protein
LVRCGPAAVAPAAPAPRPSLLSHFITCSFGHWPGLCPKQFHVPASLAGVRAEGLGFWASLTPGHTTHMILSPGCGGYVVFHVWVLHYLGCACLRWPLLATHPWLCGLHGSWRAPGARGQELAGLVAATNPGKSWRSLGLKSPSSDKGGGVTSLHSEL